MEALTSQAPGDCMPLWRPASCRAALGVALQILPNLAWVCTVPATGSFPQRAARSIVKELPARPSRSEASLARGRAGHKGQSPGPDPRPLHPDPRPSTAHQQPGTPESDSAAQPQSVQASRSQFLPAHRRFTAPARRARRPSPTKARCLTVPTAVPRRPEGGPRGPERSGLRRRLRENILRAGAGSYLQGIRRG